MGDARGVRRRGLPVRATGDTSSRDGRRKAATDLTGERAIRQVGKVMSNRG